MKNSIKIVTALFLGTALSHCASMVNQEQQKNKTGTRAVIGEKGFTRSAGDCPNGIIWTNVIDMPSGTEFHSGAALSTEALDDKLNPYILTTMRHYGFDQENKALYAKAPIEQVFTKLMVEFSPDEAGTSASDPELNASTAVAVGEAFDIDYFHKLKVYGKQGTIKDGFLREERVQNPPTQKVIRSLKISTDVDGVTSAAFPIPASILGPDVTTNYSKPLSAEVDGELQLEWQPAAGEGVVQIQLTNRESKGEGVTYEAEVDDVEGTSSVTIPMKGVKEGDYKLIIARTSKNNTELDGLNVCVDIGSVVETSVKVSKPKAK